MGALCERQRLLEVLALKRPGEVVQRWHVVGIRLEDLTEGGDTLGPAVQRHVARRQLHEHREIGRLDLQPCPQDLQGLFVLPLRPQRPGQAERQLGVRLASGHGGETLRGGRIVSRPEGDPPLDLQELGPLAELLPQPRQRLPGLAHLATMDQQVDLTHPGREVGAVELDGTLELRLGLRSLPATRQALPIEEACLGRAGRDLRQLLERSLGRSDVAGGQLGLGVDQKEVGAARQLSLAQLPRDRQGRGGLARSQVRLSQRGAHGNRGRDTTERCLERLHPRLPPRAAGLDLRQEQGRLFVLGMRPGHGHQQGAGPLQIAGLRLQQGQIAGGRGLVRLDLQGLLQLALRQIPLAGKHVTQCEELENLHVPGAALVHLFCSLEGLGHLARAQGRQGPEEFPLVRVVGARRAPRNRSGLVELLPRHQPGDAQQIGRHRRPRLHGDQPAGVLEPPGRVPLVQGRRGQHAQQDRVVGRVTQRVVEHHRRAPVVRTAHLHGPEDPPRRARLRRLGVEALRGGERLLPVAEREVGHRQVELHGRVRRSRRRSSLERQERVLVLALGGERHSLREGHVGVVLQPRPLQRLDVRLRLGELLELDPRERALGPREADIALALDGLAEGLFGKGCIALLQLDLAQHGPRLRGRRVGIQRPLQRLARLVILLLHRVQNCNTHKRVDLLRLARQSGIEKASRLVHVPQAGIRRPAQGVERGRIRGGEVIRPRLTPRRVLDGRLDDVLVAPLQERRPRQRHPAGGLGNAQPLRLFQLLLRRRAVPDLEIEQPRQLPGLRAVRGLLQRILQLDERGLRLALLVLRPGPPHVLLGARPAAARQSEERGHCRHGEGRAQRVCAKHGRAKHGWNLEAEQDSGISD